MSRPFYLLAIQRYEHLTGNYLRIIYISGWKSVMVLNMLPSIYRRIKCVVISDTGISGDKEIKAWDAWYLSGTFRLMASWTLFVRSTRSVWLLLLIFDFINSQSSVRFLPGLGVLPLFKQAVCRGISKFLPSSSSNTVRIWIFKNSLFQRSDL